MDEIDCLGRVEQAAVLSNQNEAKNSTHSLGSKRSS
jgi:hypothetical protein